MITYREASALDIPVLVSLDREYFPHTAWPAEQFRAEIGKATRFFLVGESANQIIAYAGAFLPNAGGEGDIIQRGGVNFHAAKGERRRHQRRAAGEGFDRLDRQAMAFDRRE